VAGHTKQVVHEALRCQLLQELQELGSHEFLQKAMDSELMKFNIMCQKLNELTTKHSEVSSSRSSTERSHVPISLYPLLMNAMMTHRRLGSSTKTFSQWIDHETREK
jgi:hypothetical protein